MLRRTFIALAAASVLTACAGAGGGGGSVSEGNPATPELTETVAADLSARALAIACEQQCVGNEVPVRDLVFESQDQPLEGPQLSDAQRRAITQQFMEVRFLTDEEASDVLTSDGVTVAIGPVTATEDGRAEVEVVAEAADGPIFYIQHYRWSGGDWVPTP